MTTLVKIIVDSDAKRYATIRIESNDHEMSPKTKSEDYKVPPGSMFEVYLHSHQCIVVGEGGDYEKDHQGNR